MYLQDIAAQKPNNFSVKIKKKKNKQAIQAERNPQKNARVLTDR
jgi:hypothetical protein